MKLLVFLNEYRESEILDRFKADKMGIVLVQNGVYHASLKNGGNESAILSSGAELYALSEDFQTRGFSDSDVDSRVKVINFDGLVDLMLNDYEKTIWL